MVWTEQTFFRLQQAEIQRNIEGNIPSIMWAYNTDLYTVVWPQDFRMYICRVKLGRLISWTFI